MLSILLYGVETWPITVANGRILEVTYHRRLRRILHVSWRDKISNKTIIERTGQEELSWKKEIDVVGSYDQNEHG